MHYLLQYKMATTMYLLISWPLLALGLEWLLNMCTCYFCSTKVATPMSLLNDEPLLVLGFNQLVKPMHQLFLQCNKMVESNGCGHGGIHIVGP